MQEESGLDSVVPIIAGSVSTTLFAFSAVPMLWKACATRDLRSYSLLNLAIANAGNLVHSIYVFSLPPGPIWALHVFYLVTTGVMLLLYMRYGGTEIRSVPGSDHSV